MKKVLSFVTFLLSLAGTASAQTWAEVSSSPDDFVWGEGWGSTLEEADNQALSMLASRISLIVFNEFRSVEGQVLGNAGRMRYSAVENNMHSYTAASLTNTGVEVLGNGDRPHVVRWIRRDEIERINERRRSRVCGYISEAQRCEDEGKAGDAIRAYYWAYSMVRSYQELSFMTYTGWDGRRHVLTNWLPEKISEMFSDIRVHVRSISQDSATLSFTFRGEPVSGLGFSFFDGSRWVGPVYVCDGRQTVTLSYNTPPEYLHLRFEYAFAPEARSDRELVPALECMSREPLRQAHVSLYCRR